MGFTLKKRKGTAFLPGFPPELLGGREVQLSGPRGRNAVGIPAWSILKRKRTRRSVLSCVVSHNTKKG